MGSIEHDGYLRFGDVPLDGVRAITVSVASAGAGGWIEVRRGSNQGELLGEVQVDVNGDWEAFAEKRIELLPATGRDDVYLVFRNSENRGGLMNIDALTFDTTR
jgi:cytochrome c